MNNKIIIKLISIILISAYIIFPSGVKTYADETEKISISDVSYYATSDGNGEKISDLLGREQISVKAKVSNKDNTMKKVGVYLAFYDKNGMIKNVGYNTFDIEFGTTQEICVDTKIDAGNAVSGTYARAFIWDETKGEHTPVMNDVKIKSSYDVYVSPNGEDNADGSICAPVKSIEKAKEIAKAKKEETSEDVNVYLREGIYQLSDTLKFSSGDSGKNDNFINYKTYNGENAVISGGRKIENWEVYNAEKNIWSAKITELENVRELYVNGIKGTIAKSETKVFPKGFYTETVDEVEKKLGYIVSAEDVPVYKNPEDIKLHFTQIWKNTLCPVKEIKEGSDGNNILILDDTVFQKLVSSSRYVPLRHDTSFYVENVFELLDVAGEFYFDKKEKTLYYKANDNISMAESEVYVPFLEKLIEIKGDRLDNKAKNISFSGITFAHSTRSDMDNGYLGDQAQEYDPINQISSSYPVDNKFVGGNIRVSASENIRFTDNVFTGLSAVGVGLYDGANNITIKGNTFYDIGDSAVTVGLPTDAFMEEVYQEGVNVALFKPVTSNGEVSTTATLANDGDRTTIWSNPTNKSTDYLQIDLGKEYKISQVRLKSRLGTNDSATNTYKTQSVHRRGFTIYASNDENFEDGGVILATVSNTAGNEFDYDSGFAGDVSLTDKFRYIRFSTTVNKHFPLAEIEVISPDVTSQNKEVCKNSLISNNYITRIGDTNWGAPGIQLYHTEGIDVVHNELKNVPYSGICVGWGWSNKSGSQTTKNNTISYNVIDSFAERMYDAGGVYMNGPQFNTQINNNYIKNQNNIYYALYSDSGSMNFTAKNNVFEDVSVIFALGRTGNLSSKTGITIKDNYSTSVKYNYAFTEGNDSVVDDPIFYLRKKPLDKVSEIISQAGLESGYEDLSTKVTDSTYELSLIDIYGDVIDRHVGYYTDTITSLTDYNLITYYLDYAISDAKALYNEGKSYVNYLAQYKFNKAISDAEKSKTNFVNQTKDENGKVSHETENVDRKAVIEARITLQKAALEFINSFK